MELESEAERIFEEFLRQREREGGADFDRFCAENLSVEPELRRLHGIWSGVVDALGARDDDSIDDRYRRERELGRGGMGVVYEVYDTQLERTLAMKVIRAGAAPDRAAESRSVRRFVEEAKITGRMGHPGIVPVHDLGVDDEGRLYYTMPRVNGRTFEEIIELVRTGADGWSRTRALNVLASVCETMAFAHANGVLHRDLKPSNVMVGEFGETFVLDWGLAHVRDERDRRDLRLRPASEGDAAFDSPLLTMEGDVVGTPIYMSPEQARGEIGRLDARSDVYSMGAILRHLLALRPPYVGEDERVGARVVLVRVLEGPPEPLDRAAADVAPELVAICEAAMAREPEERYESMAFLASDLRAFLETRVVRAYERGGLAELRKWIRRNRTLAASLAVAAAAAIVGIVLAGQLVFERLSRRLQADFIARQGLEVEAVELWPIGPELVPRIERALEVAGDLVSRRDRHRARYEDDPEESSDDARRTREHVRALDAFAAPGGLLEQLRDRLARSRSLERRSLRDAAPQWAQARAAIAADPRYGGLDLAPQLGLVPLGPNPAGLWEFAHLPSGEPARRGAGGEHVLGPETGLVLVLLPGGSFPMGESVEPDSGDHERRYYRGDWRIEELPVHTVSLDPFFLSKYELTVAQLERFWGPQGDDLRVGPRPLSAFQGPGYSGAVRAARHLGLVLPTEAQWEYAARAGTTTRWWLGDDLDALPERASEGAFLVGQRPPNPWGLFDVEGNVAELCSDVYAAYSKFPSTRARDGRRIVDPAGQNVTGLRVARGGADFGGLERFRRAAARHTVVLLGERRAYRGVRPARALDRDERDRAPSESGRR